MWQRMSEAARARMQAPHTKLRRKAATMRENSVWNAYAKFQEVMSSSFTRSVSCAHTTSIMQYQDTREEWREGRKPCANQSR